MVEVRDCRTLEAEIANKLAALVLDLVRTFHALEGGLGVFVAECSGFLVIGLAAPVSCVPPRPVRANSPIRSNAPA